MQGSLSAQTEREPSSYVSSGYRLLEAGFLLPLPQRLLYDSGDVVDFILCKVVVKRYGYARPPQLFSDREVAVSYTHLDVYKRQIYYAAKEGRSGQIEYTVI